MCSLHWRNAPPNACIPWSLSCQRWSSHYLYKIQQAHAGWTISHCQCEILPAQQFDASDTDADYTTKLTVYTLFWSEKTWFSRQTHIGMFVAFAASLLGDNIHAVLSEKFSGCFIFLLSPWRRLGNGPSSEPPRTLYKWQVCQQAYWQAVLLMDKNMIFTAIRQKRLVVAEDFIYYPLLSVSEQGCKKKSQKYCSQRSDNNSCYCPPSQLSLRSVWSTCTGTYNLLAGAAGEILTGWRPAFRWSRAVVLRCKNLLTMVYIVTTIVGLTILCRFSWNSPLRDLLYVFSIVCCPMSKCLLRLPSEESMATALQAATKHCCGWRSLPSKIIPAFLVQDKSKIKNLS